MEILHPYPRREKINLAAMGLNLSNEQIAHELSLNESDAYQMTTALRGGIVKKADSDAIQRGGV